MVSMKHEEKVTKELERARELYHEKNEKVLSVYGKLVTPEHFYRELFPEGSFERKMHYQDEKPNGIVLELLDGGRRVKREIVTDDHNSLLKPRDGFTITSPISYYGKQRTGVNARFIYALAFDIDGQGLQQTTDLLYQMKNEHLPMASYVVNSGYGVHVYYLFDEPIPLYPQNQKYLRAIKYALTRQLWNRYTSYFKEVQYQGIMQGFRVVGSPSKLGKEYPVCAYAVWEHPLSISQLIEYIPSSEFKGKNQEANIKDLEEYATMGIEEAKEKYPQWYQRRVVEQIPAGHWICNRALYDWWLKKLKEEVKVGHRYFGVMALAVYGRKCNIPLDEVRADAYSVLGALDALTTEERNHFTEKDIVVALEMYNEDYITFPRRVIEKLTGVPMPANKRNGRKQKVHIKYMNNQRDFKVELGECTNGGRPNKEKEVLEWRKQNPNGRKADCIKETCLAKMTVYKYWDL